MASGSGRTDPQRAPEPRGVDVHSAWRLAQQHRAILIDVREPHEYRMEHIPGSLCLPLSYLETAAFPQVFQVPVVLVCDSGKRSAAAGRELLCDGVRSDFCNLEGGLEAWRSAGLPTQGARFDVDDYAI